MNRGKISNVLRNLGLIYFTDWVRFYVERYKNRKKNEAFARQNPTVKLPPDYLIYESFQLDYEKYYLGGKQTAEWLATHFGKHLELKNKRILDWGCGPGRVIRHLPEVIGKGCEFYGTDYNADSIKWCSQHLPGIHFNNNSLEARLPYADNFFDVIYGISIFTHLSEQLHFDWYQELHRVLKPGGIMFLTTQGENFKVKMTETERQQFRNGELVVRGQVKEGHRTYSAFHPEPFMQQLFEGAQILEHIADKPESGSWLPQDIWIVRKK